MAVSYVATTTASLVASTADLVIDTPPGTQDRDLMVLSWAATSAVHVSMEDFGWSQITISDPFTSRFVELWAKIADSEPATQTIITQPTVNTIVASLTTYHGVDQLEPVPVASVATNTSASTTIVIPSVTPTRSGSMLHAAVGGQSGTWSPPGSITERWDLAAGGANPVNGAGGEEALASTAATGTRTFTQSTSTTNAGAMCVISADRQWTVGRYRFGPEAGSWR